MYIIPIKWYHLLLHVPQARQCVCKDIRTCPSALLPVSAHYSIVAKKCHVAQKTWKCCVKHDSVYAQLAE